MLRVRDRIVGSRGSSGFYQTCWGQWGALLNARKTHGRERLFEINRQHFVMSRGTCSFAWLSNSNASSDGIIIIIQ